MYGSGINDDSFINTQPGILRQFANHVFSTTTESKTEVLNTLQYIFCASIPIFLLNKGVAMFIPLADDMKGSLEIVAEIVVQLLFMIMGIILIHRCITYFPTYSGYKYDPLILTNNILTFLILLFSIQSKLSAKMNILYFRIQEYIDNARGKTDYVPPPVSSNVPPPVRPDMVSGSNAMAEHNTPPFFIKPATSSIQF